MPLIIKDSSSNAFTSLLSLRNNCRQPSRPFAGYQLSSPQAPGHSPPHPRPNPMADPVCHVKVTQPQIGMNETDRQATH